MRTRTLCLDDNLQCSLTLSAPSTQSCAKGAYRTKELAGIAESQQVRRLEEILREAGMEGRPTLEKCKAIKAQRELAQELSDIDPAAIIDAPRRHRAAAAVSSGGKELKRPSASASDDDDDDDVSSGNSSSASDSDSSDGDTSAQPPLPKSRKRFVASDDDDD